MKNVVWVFSENSKKYPRLTTSFLKKEQRYGFYLFYICIWLVVSYFLRESIDDSIKFTGFIVGLILIYLFDLLNNQLYTVLITQNGKYYLTKSVNDYHILKKDSLNQLNLKPGQCILLKKEVFEKLKREKQINVIPLYKFYNPKKTKYIQGNLWKFFDSPIDSGNDYNQLDNASYNYVAILLTILGVVRSINRSLFKKILPWSVLAILFSICSQILFRWNVTYKQVINEFIYKQKLFLVSISFGISILLTLFYYSNI